MQNSALANFGNNVPLPPISDASFIHLFSLSHPYSLLTKLTANQPSNMQRCFICLELYEGYVRKGVNARHDACAKRLLTCVKASSGQKAECALQIVATSISQASLTLSSQDAAAARQIRSYLPPEQLVPGRGLPEEIYSMIFFRFYLPDHRSVLQFDRCRLACIQQTRLAGNTVPLFDYLAWTNTVLPDLAKKSLEQEQSGHLLLTRSSMSCCQVQEYSSISSQPNIDFHYQFVPRSKACYPQFLSTKILSHYNIVGACPIFYDTIDLPVDLAWLPSAPLPTQSPQLMMRRKIPSNTTTVYMYFLCGTMVDFICDDGDRAEMKRFHILLGRFDAERLVERQAKLQLGERIEDAYVRVARHHLSLAVCAHHVHSFI